MLFLDAQVRYCAHYSSDIIAPVCVCVLCGICKNRYPTILLARKNIQMDSAVLVCDFRAACLDACDFVLAWCRWVILFYDFPSCVGVDGSACYTIMRHTRRRVFPVVHGSPESTRGMCAFVRVCFDA